MKNRVLHHYWPEIKRYRLWLVGAFFAFVITSSVNVVYPFLLRGIVDSLSLPKEEGYTQSLHYLKILFVIWITYAAVNFAFYRTITSFEIRGMKSLNKRCFAFIQSHSFRFFSDNFTGSLLKKMARFVNAFERLADVIFYNFLKDFVQIITIIVIFFLESAAFGFAFLVWSTIFIVGNYYFSIWKMKFDKEVALLDSRLSGHIADSFSNFSTVKIFASEKREQKRFSKMLDTWSVKMRISWFLSQNWDFLQGISMAIIEFVIFFLALSAWKNGDFTVGDFIFLQTYILMSFMNLWGFGRNIRNFYRDISFSQEMADIFDTEIEIKNVKNAGELAVNKGEIEFRNVSFSYGEKQVFKNFSLKIKPQESVALVGHSGVGKTTIVQLLFRFFDIQKGQILIDEQDIAKITQESLRKNLSLVPQDPNLFHRSISENIAYGHKNATEAEILEASKKANAHKFVMSLTEKYESYVGERGIKLSGGEKQRVAIARVILENANILVLDEATSALDSLTEGEIQKAIENVMKDKTTIIIAHRLSTVKKVDRVVVLDENGICEEGTHDELIAKNGAYAKLWSHQVGGFLVE